MDPSQSRTITSHIHLLLEQAAEALGCANPLIEVRLKDTDFEPEPAEYIDVAVAMRFPLSAYHQMQNELKAQQPGIVFQEQNG